MTSLITTEEIDSQSVYVSNLHANVTKELIHELFIQAGPVALANKIFLKGARSLQSTPESSNDVPEYRYTFVEFKHAESVPFAIEMLNGIKLFGKPLWVRRCREQKELVDQIQSVSRAEVVVKKPQMRRSWPIDNNVRVMDDSNKLLNWNFNQFGTPPPRTQGFPPPLLDLRMMSPFFQQAPPALMHHTATQMFRQLLQRPRNFHHERQPIPGRLPPSIPPHPFMPIPRPPHHLKEKLKSRNRETSASGSKRAKMNPLLEAIAVENNLVELLPLPGTQPCSRKRQADREAGELDSSDEEQQTPLEKKHRKVTYEPESKSASNSSSWRKHSNKKTGFW
uniref:RRM domain-containing protein n=1 Tax=Acrobeloides nanus TaxID=290746 RepID=A0A914BZJ4_9BILA